MIIVRVIGGLGNQMFQTALIKRLEADGYEVKADLTDFGAAHLINHNGFEIESIFGRLFNRASAKEINRVKNNGSLNYYIRRVLNLIFKKELNHYRENKVTKQMLRKGSDFLSSKNIYLDGYWQSEDFFSEISDEIRSIFSFPELKQSKNITLKKEMEASSSVSIHVRGGDYLTNPSVYKKYGCICSPEYYRNSIAYIRSKISNPKFFIFSNDFEWVKKNLDISSDESVFIDWNSGENSFRDIQMMSYCKNRIIANSSFSWWGAWLSGETGYTLCPEKWKVDETKEDIYPENWTKIPIS